jgi:hypothetical protein
MDQNFIVNDLLKGTYMSVQIKVTFTPKAVLMYSLQYIKQDCYNFHYMHSYMILDQLIPWQWQLKTGCML